MIGPGADRRGGVRQDASSMETLKMNDYESIKDECTYIKAISPVVNKSGQFIYGNENAPSTIYGVNQDYMEIRQISVADGDMFTAALHDERCLGLLVALDHCTRFDGQLSAIGDIYPSLKNIGAFL